MPDVKARLLRILRQSGDPLDYRALIETSRLPGIDIAKGLEFLESEGAIERLQGELGFEWSAVDPAIA